MTLEQVEVNQATMRTCITAIQEKMDQLLKTMLEIARRERFVEAKIITRKNNSHIGTSGLVHQEESFIHTKKSLVHIPVGNKGEGDRVEPFDASAQYGSEMGGDDLYDAFYAPNHPNLKFS